MKIHLSIALLGCLVLSAHVQSFSIMQAATGRKGSNFIKPTEQMEIKHYAGTRNGWLCLFRTFCDTSAIEVQVFSLPGARACRHSPCGHLAW